MCGNSEIRWNEEFPQSVLFKFNCEDLLPKVLHQHSMKSEELNFVGDNPGAVKHGNFINYYSFNSAKNRIKILNPLMFPQSIKNELLVCLDIGCNTGELTVELYDYLKLVYSKCNIQIVAIDIDPTLIERAKETYYNSNITFLTLDIMTTFGKETIREYLDSHKKGSFDITFCFSVTMWIHLNNGDDGLLAFLKYLKMISESLIIEAQPWNCYRNAQRRIKKSGNTFPFYESLKIRNNIEVVIEKILSEKTHNKLYESQKSSWNRKVMSFTCI